MRLANLKRLLADKLEFFLEGEVHSEELLKQRRMELSAGLAKSTILANILCVAIIFAVISSIILMLSGVVEAADGNWGWFGLGLLVGVPGVLAMFYISANETLEEKLSAELDGLAALPQSECETMLYACLATPEGMAFRNKVVAAGRQFVQAECAMVVEWANGLRQRQKCAELYAIKEAK